MKRGKIILIVLLLLLMAALIALVHYKRRSRKTSDLSNLLVFGRPDEGEWVLRLQKALNVKGYGLAEDGIFGYSTEKAVVEYFGTKTVTAAQIEELEGKTLQHKIWESENKMRNGGFDFSQVLAS